MRWEETTILWVNLSEGKIEAKPIDLNISSKYIGGRGYATRLLYDGLLKGTDPLDPDNLIIFMNGPLTGLAPSSGRCSVTSRSPLTNTICSCSVGGRFGYELRKAGFAGVVIKGKSEKRVYLSIKDGKAELVDATEIWGHDTQSALADIQEAEGRCSTALIGQGGENLVEYACIIVDGDSAAGRGGLGAVLGSKNLKGIAVEGTLGIEPVNEFAFKIVQREFLKILGGHPLTGDALNRFGTLVLLDPVNKHGIFPIKNFRSGMSERAEVISGESMRKYLHKKGACAKCSIACGLKYKIDDTISSLEFESAWALGPQCDIWDPTTILKASQKCNLLGLDTISCGNTLGFCMELSEKGLLPTKYGYGVDTLDLIEKISTRKEEGEILSLGSKRIAEKVGGKEFAINVKGMELAAYDPRGVRGQALAFATSNRGGDHLQAYMIPIEVLSQPRYIDNLSETEKPKMVKELEDVYAVLDSLCMCKFTSMAIFSTFQFECEMYARLLTTATGFYFDETEFKLAGERIFNLERAFNMREGFSRKDDALPKRFSEPMGSGALGDTTVDLEWMLNEYYKLRGWSDLGVPTETKLKELGLYEEKWPKRMVMVEADSQDRVVEIWESKRGEKDWLGLGSVTIKSIGMEGLKKLREKYPNTIILADLKTMDTGFLEVEIAALAGADIITISGLADESTIMDGVGAARKYGVEIMVDLLSADLERAKTAERLGVKYLLCGQERIGGLKDSGIGIPIASYGSDAEIQIERAVSTTGKRIEREKRGLNFEEPILQVALDLRELKDALRIGKLSNFGGANWIEAGTPLIKCEGVEAVRELRKMFPDGILIADLKTLSNSAEEVGIAAQAGADIVGISGASNDSEIEMAVEKAREIGVYIMADLIALADPVSRARELEKLGADILEFHISIDKQLRSDYAKIPFPLVREVCDSVHIPVAVAGGMKAGTAPLALKSGAKVVVVGGGITHAADPKAATEHIKRAMGEHL